MVRHACTVLWALSVAAATVTAGSTGQLSHETRAVIYDRAGVHPQCSEGPATYMRDCVLPSDYFGYILSADPALRTDTTCAKLGFELAVPNDPVFSGFALYWVGGKQGLEAFSRNFSAGHPDLQKFLNHSRDANPACRLPSEDMSAATRAISSAVRGQAAQGESAKIMTAYDTSGVLPQCAEGPADYMIDCVQRCDMVAYLKCASPTLLQGSHCKSMGYEFATMDNIYTPVSLFWKSSLAPGGISIGDYFGPYFKNHTAAFGYLNATRDATPSCKLK